MAGMPGPHDIGGMNFGGGQIAGQIGGAKKAGPVPREEHVFAGWERRADAVNRLIGGGGKQFYILDEMRRTIESLSPEDYFSLSYYERWIKALEALLIEKGVLSRTEIDGRLAALRQA